ncbi:hypothetical protein [Zavarzinella formosa]|uniref:hypothetical protein n=1 Tax=Zavarzinella formosa TaxID=360055 RepID=UPI0002D627E3|nr:hypothetical protein [Zavarzinella formosa]
MIWPVIICPRCSLSACSETGPKSAVFPEKAGLMMVMVEAITLALELSADRVTSVRKDISLCRRGKHEAIRSLRVKT